MRRKAHSVPRGPQPLSAGRPKRNSEQFTTPEDHRKFTELYNVQHLAIEQARPGQQGCITTIQRLYSMLKGEAKFDPEIEEAPLGSLEGSTSSPAGRLQSRHPHRILRLHHRRRMPPLDLQPLASGPRILRRLSDRPHRDALEADVRLFQQNLVSEYSHEQAVADGVNVGFDVYRIRPKSPSTARVVEAGIVGRKARPPDAQKRVGSSSTRTLTISDQLDRDVVTPDQIRTIIRTFRDKLFTEIFPGRTEVPKTLIFAKDDSHAEDIVHIVREEFGKGNDFCQKITYKAGVVRIPVKRKLEDGTEVDEYEYKSSGITAEQRISDFRNNYNPRIAVTVDMIATGTDGDP